MLPNSSPHCLKPFKSKAGNELSVGTVGVVGVVGVIGDIGVVGVVGVVGAAAAGDVASGPADPPHAAIVAVIRRALKNFTACRLLGSSLLGCIVNFPL